MVTELKKELCLMEEIHEICELQHIIYTLVEFHQLTGGLIYDPICSGLIKRFSYLEERHFRRKYDKIINSF